MNKCLPVHGPQGPFKPAGLGSRDPAGTGVGLKGTAPNAPRHSLGFSFLALLGSTESPSLHLMLFRVLVAVAQLAGVVRKRSVRGQVRPGSSHGAEAMLTGPESSCPPPASRGEGGRRPGEGKLMERSREHSQGEARASDSGTALVALAEPNHNGHSVNFRGVWTHSRPGACFERKGLMRITHRHSS